MQILNLQAGFQLCGLVFNLVAMTFVDRVKRSWLIAIGLMGCALVMMVETILQYLYLDSSSKPGLAAAAAMIFTFQAVYSLFLDGATFFYIAEIWPSHLRPQGFAIGMATLCLSNLMWLLAAPTAMAKISWRYYLFFICIPAIGAAVVFFYYQDTLRKPLEEIAAMFGDDDLVAIYQHDLDDANLELNDFEHRDNTEGKPIIVEKLE